MQSLLLILLCITLALLVISLGVTIFGPLSKSRKKYFSGTLSAFVYACTIIQLCITGFAGWIITREPPSVHVSAPDSVIQHQPQNQPQAESQDQTAAQTDPMETTTAPTVDPRTQFTILGSTTTNPDNFGVTWEIRQGDTDLENFTREEPICFELDSEYFALPGIATFRGNNYRNNASYGTAEIEKETMSVAWSHKIGSLNKWGGCAWTGQPLLVQWDPETKAIMQTMYDSKKAKEDLVEVIYATLDGYIHFYDLEDGSKTRDAINMGMNFKGAGALDPRGYPLLYVGSGLYINNKGPRMFVVSLIDGKILYEYGDKDDFILRDWTAFDSSPLVDAESDTLIWPGESGVLYTIKLNTQYDKQSGTISVNPEDPVKTRYTSTYSEEGKRYLGYEGSAVVVDHYWFNCENGGLFHCVDLNTMELLWTQDIRDDANSSPLFEWGEDGKGYIYTAPALHYTMKNHEGTISIMKLDASTGEILWEYEEACVRYDDIAGGVQASPLIGREDSNISGLIIYPIARTPSAYRGLLVALDKETGEKIWEISSGNYAWSSPIALYTEDGHAYIYLCNASGVSRLIDGSTGEVLATLDFDQTVEASPVAFGNMLVIGSREAVYGIKVS